MAKMMAMNGYEQLRWSEAIVMVILDIIMINIRYYNGKDDDFYHEWSRDDGWTRYI